MFAVLDQMEPDCEDDTDTDLKNYDTEFIATDAIRFNPANTGNVSDILVSATSVHISSATDFIDKHKIKGEEIDKNQRRKICCEKHQNTRRKKNTFRFTIEVLLKLLEKRKRIKAFIGMIDIMNLNCSFQTYKSVICLEWMYNRIVIIIRSNVATDCFFCQSI